MVGEDGAIMTVATRCDILKAMQTCTSEVSRVQQNCGFAVAL